MRRTLLTLFLACGACFGQGSSTIGVKVFSNIAATQASSPLQNIGQGSHLVQVIEVNAPAQSCTTDTNIFVRLESSLDNVTWTPFGAPISTVQVDPFGNLTGSTVAFGAFPFIRINVVGFSSTQCRLTAYYSGTLYPSGLTSSLSGVQSNYQHTFNEISSGAGKYTIVSTPNGLGRIVVYGLTITNESASATTFQMYENSTSNCSGGASLGGILQLTTTGLAAGQTIPIGPSTVPVYVGLSTTNDALCIQTTNAGVLHVSLVYRVE
jgi:hypothetical protein